MTIDKNKGITTAITYNHLNLPTKIIFGTTGTIEYLYNAQGQKVKKTVTIGTAITVTDYLDGYQYTNNVLDFFAHSEGYVKNTVVGTTNNYNYVFNYTDHLGNIRVSYGLDSSNVLKILEENNYYPFGLKHKNYNVTNKSYANGGGSVNLFPCVNCGYKYKYNGKELQDELGLNMYDYGARNYDPAIGRWMNIDPLAETSRRFSPYTYALNNPVYFIDPDGMEAEHVKITGDDAKKATKELDKSTNLKLSRDEKTGLLSATGEAKNDYDKALLESINSTDITVNLKTTTSETFAVGGVVGDIIVGAYAGSSKTKDGKVETNQFINMNHAEKVEDAGATKQGNSVGHEVIESFVAAKENGGINRPNSENGDEAYTKWHNEAIKVDPNFIDSDRYDYVAGQKLLSFPNLKVPVKLN